MECNESLNNCVRSSQWLKIEDRNVYTVYYFGHLAEFDLDIRVFSDQIS